MSLKIRITCYSVILVVLSITCAGAFANVERPDPKEDWPRVHTLETGKVVMYQPQIESWDDYKHFVAKAALQVIPAGKESGIYGAIHLEADTQVNYQTRMVLVQKIQATDLNFPNSDPEAVEEATKIANELISQTHLMAISLDRMIAALEISNLQHPVIDVNLNPPPVFYSSEPAILVMFIGEPKLETIKDNDLMFAANTNWDLFLDPASGNYYLLNEDSWLKTEDLAKGPWEAAGDLPKGLSQLPDDENWTDVKKHIPGKPDADIPKVFIANQPSELIVTDGEPSYTPITGTHLLYVPNTDSDLFLHSQEKTHYFLTAGRWFSAQNLEGPWSAASEDLPEDFTMIPPEHPMGHVLSSVPGTSEADAAILLATIPEKATVKRDEAKLEVTYDGDPDFKPIESTEVQYAVNTPESVFVVNNQYYCCKQGIWFVSSSPNGPWEVCDSVPDEIYSIPPDHPKYNVTYVNVYDSNPETVTVGYTSGYTGAYVAATGALMFGLGYWAAEEMNDYDDWYDYCYAYTPAYWGYGCGAAYDYYHGGYVRAAQYYGPYGGAGRAAAYNPATGTYARGAYAYGPYGSASARAAYNPRTDNYAAGFHADTAYGSWGRGVVSDGDEWAQGRYRSTDAGTVAGGRTSEGGGFVAGESNITGESRGIGKDQYGDVYVGKDGNVYKKDSGGEGWSKYDGSGNWSDVDHASPRSENRQARAEEGGGGAEQFDRTQVQTNRQSAQTSRSENLQARTGQDGQQVDRSQLQSNRQSAQSNRSQNIQSRTGQSPQQFDRSQFQSNRSQNPQSRSGQAPQQFDPSQFSDNRGSGSRGGYSSSGFQGSSGGQFGQSRGGYSNMDHLNRDFQSRQSGNSRAQGFQQRGSAGGRGGASMGSRGGGSSRSFGGAGGGRGGGGGRRR